MTRYILIDNGSGYVWGEANAETPEEACRIVDAHVGAYDRTYFEAYSLASNESGYHVYEVRDNFPEIEDGQDLETIMAVEALRRVGTFQIVGGVD
jgi:hypothetical protein